ncbi:uncharacterized protein [Lolium perenne]|jgi:hypothetical protein|uniref:uncharacterized protein n=1 Tax=Lolium perenne TaxID=4522 RepID=UPI0021EB4F80|nr:uncharacterized protein LOC127299415 [Lolium perenne]
MEQQGKASEVDGAVAGRGAPSELSGVDTAEDQRGGGGGGNDGGAIQKLMDDEKKKTTTTEEKDVKPLPHKQVPQPSDVYNPELERL